MTTASVTYTNTSAKAQSRWKLLRQAIKKQHISREEPQFAGYHMLPDLLPLNVADDDVQEAMTRLITIPENCKDVVACLEESIICLVTLDPKCQEIVFDVSPSQLQALDTEQVSYLLTNVCKLQYCHVNLDAKNNHLILSFALSWLASTYTFCRLYLSSSVETKDALILRQRKQLKLSLEELTSHNNQVSESCTLAKSIDNTGNIGIWDCENILTWVLQQPEVQCRMPDKCTVIELGVGMAGIAALSLAYSKASKIILTDGNVGSVQNNRAHLRMMECMKLLPTSCTYECQQLFWNMDAEAVQLQPQADITLVSDCTHFEHYHGELLHTLVTCTKIGGTIWMCHPQRGRSLSNFLALISVVNKVEPLLILERHERFNELEEKHACFLQNDQTYMPNVHKPLVFSLKKLRDILDTDRCTTFQHLTATN